MVRSFVHRREAGLEHFILTENQIDKPDLSDVTAITVVVGSTTVYSTAYNDGPVRWNTSELQQGEIVALVPTSGFTDDNEDATITITSPTYPAGLAWATKTIPVTDAAFFGTGGEQREQCEVCGRWFPVTQLVRQNRILRRDARDNALYYSRYDASNWALTGANYLGEVSMGRSTKYWKVHPYKNANMAGGCRSFWGDGEIVANDGIDLSTYTTALLRGRFGTHQTTSHPGITIGFGFYYDYGGGGQTRYLLGSRSNIEGKTAWIVDDLSGIDPGHLSDLQIFFDIDTYDDQQIWWAENLRVQKDASAPLFTSAWSAGAPIDDSFLMTTYGKMVVCPDHRLKFEKQVNEYQQTVDETSTVEDLDEEF